MLTLRTIKMSVDSVVVALFAAVVSLPLITGLTSSGEDIRRTEKRTATELPDFELSQESLSTFPARFEKFYDDHFGFREQLIRLHNLVKVFMFSVSPSNRVVLGKSGWLFYSSDWDGDPVADYRNLDQFRQDALQRKAGILVRRNNWLASQGIDYLYVIVPNKSTLYPEYMPDRLNRVRPRSLLDQFADHVRGNTGVALLDLRPDLTAAKQTLPVYTRTGSHWNDFGAYVGSKAIVEWLGGRFEQIRPESLSAGDFTRTLSPGDDLALMLGMDELMTEQAIVRPAWPPDCGKKAPIETPRFTVYWGKSFAQSCGKAGVRALVFRDSFSENLVPYLSEQFGYVAYVWTRPNEKAFNWFVNRHKPDVVIEIHVERYLRKYP
jgi:hypothetical protein